MLRDLSTLKVNAYAIAPLMMPPYQMKIAVLKSTYFPINLRKSSGKRTEKNLALMVITIRINRKEKEQLSVDSETIENPR